MLAVQGRIVFPSGSFHAKYPPPKPHCKGFFSWCSLESCILRTQPRFLGGLQIEDLTIADPHREYFVGLTNLASGHLLSAAKPGGWRYLLIHGKNAVGAAVLDADAKTGKARGFNALQQSGFASATLEALRKAEELPQIKKQNYELRYLGIPAVSFVAVWLHAESDDILIPLPPTYGRMNAYQPFSESQICQLLKASVERARKWGETVERKMREPR